MKCTLEQRRSVKRQASAIVREGLTRLRDAASLCDSVELHTVAGELRRKALALETYHRLRFPSRG